jgi:CheY-like chemotaxis protein
MPGIDGFMLADMAKVSRPDLKVIYATGYSDEVNTKPGVRHGTILEKPYSPERLREEVRLALGS